MIKCPVLAGYIRVGGRQNRHRHYRGLRNNHISCLMLSPKMCTNVSRRERACVRARVCVFACVLLRGRLTQEVLLDVWICAVFSVTAVRSESVKNVSMALCYNEGVKLDSVTLPGDRQRRDTLKSAGWESERNTELCCCATRSFFSLLLYDWFCLFLWFKSLDLFAMF